VIAYRYSTIIYWTKFPWVSNLKKKAIFTFRTAFSLSFAMKFQRRHCLEDFAWRVELAWNAWHKNSGYRGVCFLSVLSLLCDIVPWRLVSTSLYVDRVKISCGLLPTRFSSNFVLNSIAVKKCEISNTFLTQMIYIVWKLAKNYIWDIWTVTRVFQVLLELWAVESVFSD
jgi:hypothetical protein